MINMLEQIISLIKECHRKIAPRSAENQADVADSIDQLIAMLSTVKVDESTQDPLEQRSPNALSDDVESVTSAIVVGEDDVMDRIQNLLDSMRAT
jgi:hypothetical protein